MANLVLPGVRKDLKNRKGANVPPEASRLVAKDRFSVYIRSRSKVKDGLAGLAISGIAKPKLLVGGVPINGFTDNLSHDSPAPRSPAADDSLSILQVQGLKKTTPPGITFNTTANKFQGFQKTALAKVALNNAVNKLFARKPALGAPTPAPNNENSKDLIKKQRSKTRIVDVHADDINWNDFNDPTKMDENLRKQRSKTTIVDIHADDINWNDFNDPAKMDENLNLLVQAKSMSVDFEVGKGKNLPGIVVVPKVHCPHCLQSLSEDNGIPHQCEKAADPVRGAPLALDERAAALLEDEDISHFEIRGKKSAHSNTSVNRKPTSTFDFLKYKESKDHIERRSSPDDETKESETELREEEKDLTDENLAVQYKMKLFRKSFQSITPENDSTTTKRKEANTIKPTSNDTRKTADASATVDENQNATSKPGGANNKGHQEKLFVTKNDPPDVSLAAEKKNSDSEFGTSGKKNNRRLSTDPKVSSKQKLRTSNSAISKMPPSPSRIKRPDTKKQQKQADASKTKPSEDSTQESNENGNENQAETEEKTRRNSVPKSVTLEYKPEDSATGTMMANLNNRRQTPPALKTKKQDDAGQIVRTQGKPDDTFSIQGGDISQTNTQLSAVQGAGVRFSIGNEASANRSEARDKYQFKVRKDSSDSDSESGDRRSSRGERRRSSDRRNYDLPVMDLSIQSTMPVVAKLLERRGTRNDSVSGNPPPRVNDAYPKRSFVKKHNIFASLNEGNNNRHVSGNRGRTGSRSTDTPSPDRAHQFLQADLMALKLASLTTAEHNFSFFQLPVQYKLRNQSIVDKLKSNRKKKTRR